MSFFGVKICGKKAPQIGRAGAKNTKNNLFRGRVTPELPLCYRRFYPLFRPKLLILFRNFRVSHVTPESAQHFTGLRAPLSPIGPPYLYTY